MGALAGRGDLARDALSPGGRGTGPVRNVRTRRSRPRHHAGATARGPVDVVTRPGAAGTRQQRAGHPRLRRALDRPRRRLLERPRHQRHRPHGGPRDAAHIEPAHRELAATRRVHRTTGHRHVQTHGRGRRPPEPARSPLRAHGAGIPTASHSGPPAISSSREETSRTVTPRSCCTRIAGGEKPRLGDSYPIPPFWQIPQLRR